MRPSAGLAEAWREAGRAEAAPGGVAGGPGAAAGDAADARQLGLYVHVPFCARRCGYCDFVTYTNSELGGGGARAAYAATAAAELDGLVEAVAAAGYPLTPLDTMFFGGGTPTLLPPGDLTGLVARARAALGLAADAEVTVEANPDSVGPETFEALAAGGVTRVSLGMQSAVPRVLATLDRTHAPEAVPRAVAWAKAAGLAVSVDLIYGTPGENLADWEASLRAALDLGTDHISAYALTLEPHVPLARRLAAAGSPGPDDSDEAAKYELADRLLGDAGFAWYEISNWARGPAARSRHNLGYWRGQDWLAIGPGAHGGLGGGAPVRWWNLPHPSRWAGAIAEGTLPVAGWDAPDAAGWSIERVMLGIRLAEGLPTAVLSAAGRDAIGPLEDDGLVRLERRPDGQGEEGERVVLTLRGRLLADTVTRALTA